MSNSFWSVEYFTLQFTDILTVVEGKCVHKTKPLASVVFFSLKSCACLLKSTVPQCDLHTHLTQVHLIVVNCCVKKKKKWHQCSDVKALNLLFKSHPDWLQWTKWLILSKVLFFERINAKQDEGLITCTCQGLKTDELWDTHLFRFHQRPGENY